MGKFLISLLTYLDWSDMLRKLWIQEHIMSHEHNEYFIKKETFEGVMKYVIYELLNGCFFYTTSRSSIVAAQDYVYSNGRKVTFPVRIMILTTGGWGVVHTTDSKFKPFHLEKDGFNTKSAAMAWAAQQTHLHFDIDQASNDTIQDMASDSILSLRSKLNHVEEENRMLKQQLADIEAIIKRQAC
jgi:hypothetical protein